MTIGLRYAQFSDFPRISSFLDQYWQKDYVYVRHPDLFDWTFSRPDLWDQEGYSFALMEDKDDIVGILGAIPFVFNRLGKSFRGVWFVNYMIRPDYRRGSLAMRLLSAFHRPPYSLEIAFGLNPRVAPIYQKLGWRLLKPIPRHFVVLPAATQRMKELIRMTHPDCEPDRAERLASRFTLKEMPDPSVPFAAVLPGSWDLCDWPGIASRSIGAARDANYLKWRYLKHPVFKYNFLAVPDGRRTGLAVWRLETIRRRTSQGSEDVDKIGRLVEFLPASRSNAAQLLAIFWNQLRSTGALGADSFGYHRKNNTWLEEFGFHAVETDPDGQMIPGRFQPLEPRPGTMLGAVRAQNGLSLDSEESDGIWHWTKSDADQDRPN
jgi:GNAT superfamily N-acetyltransferase